MIPIIRVKKFTDLLIEFIRTDYENATNKVNSFLYRVLEDDQDNGYDYYRNAVQIFSRDKNYKNRIETRMGFDPDRATLPTIHVREPGAQKGKTDGIGFFGDETFSNEDGTTSTNAKKSFHSKFELMITSSNVNEIIIVKEVLENAMIGAYESLQVNFFDLIDFSSKELIIQNDSYGGTPLFAKTIELDISYEKNSIPKLYTQENITAIQFNNPELLNI